MRGLGVFLISCWPFNSGRFNFINFKSGQPLGNFVDTFMDNVVNNVVDNSKYNCVDNSFSILGTTF